MGRDLNLVGYRFNWALSIFYIIYLLVEVPSNILLKRIGARFYLPFLVVGFGFVSLCTAFVQDFDQLCVARAFLGLFEGGGQSPQTHSKLLSFSSSWLTYFQLQLSLALLGISQVSTSVASSTFA